MQAILSVDLQLLGVCSLVFNVLVDACRAESLLWTAEFGERHVCRDRIQSILDY